MCYKGAAVFGHWLKASPRVRAEILIAGPQILQAGFAAATDLFTYRAAAKLYGWGSRTSLVALALTVLSPWNWFASTRTFSNSLETTLTIVAIDFWPWEWFLESHQAGKKSNGSLNTSKRSPPAKNEDEDNSVPDDLTISLAAAAMACILRPTNLLVWSTITFAVMLRGLSARKTVELAQAAFFCGGTVLAVSVAMDRHFYGDWVFPPLKFVYFNVVQSLAVFYGRNRPDYYFTEGLPLMLTSALPFAGIGMWKALRSTNARTGIKADNKGTIKFILALAVASSVMALSLISHKEVRFIFPLLPVLHVLAAGPITEFLWPDSTRLKRDRAALIALGILVNIGIAGYTTYIHQQGVVDVIHYLRHEYEAKHMLSDAQSEMTVGFLMPCHSTPWRSHLVYPDINAWALTCEPPLHLTPDQREGYLDEADVFYADPAAWIDTNMKDIKTGMDNASIESKESGDQATKAWPEYLIFFERLRPLIEKKLEGSKYGECWRGFNTHWHDDRRRAGDVVVWCTR